MRDDADNDTGETCGAWTFREALNEWLSDVRTCSTTTDGAMRIRVHFWNWLTSPVKFRTDREHNICQFMARRVRRQLDRMTGWIESESGRLAC